MKNHINTGNVQSFTYNTAYILKQMPKFLFGSHLLSSVEHMDIFTWHLKGTFYLACTCNKTCYNTPDDLVRNSDCLSSLSITLGRQQEGF